MACRLLLGSSGSRAHAGSGKGKHLWRGWTRGWTRGGTHLLWTVEIRSWDRRLALLLTKVGAIVQRWWCNVHLYLGNLIPTSRHQALALSPTQVPSPAEGSCLRHRRPEAAHRPVATAGLDVAHSYDSPGRGMPVGGPEEGTASLPSWCVAWIKKQTIEHFDSTFCCIVCD